MNLRRSYCDAACFSMQNILTISLLQHCNPTICRKQHRLADKSGVAQGKSLNHPAKVGTRYNVQIFLFYLSML